MYQINSVKEREGNEERKRSKKMKNGEQLSFERGRGLVKRVAFPSLNKGRLIEKGG